MSGPASRSMPNRPSMRRSAGRHRRHPGDHRADDGHCPRPLWEAAPNCRSPASATPGSPRRVRGSGCAEAGRSGLNGRRAQGDHEGHVRRRDVGAGAAAHGLPENRGHGAGDGRDQPRGTHSPRPASRRRPSSPVGCRTGPPPPATASTGRGARGRCDLDQGVRLRERAASALGAVPVDALDVLRRVGGVVFGEARPVADRVEGEGLPVGGDVGGHRASSSRCGRRGGRAPDAGSPYGSSTRQARSAGLPR